jgi:hypothetical protein
MSALARRLARLERPTANHPVQIVVPCYPGMSNGEGLTLTFGDAPPPAGAQVIFVENALPPPNVDYDWWTTLDRDSEAFADAYGTCRAEARKVNAGLPQNRNGRLCST